MPVAYGSHFEAVVAFSSSTTYNQPTGTSEDDTLVLYHFSANVSGGTPSAPPLPTGFVQFDTATGNIDGADCRVTYARKIAGTSEPPSYTVNHGAQLGLGFLVRYTGADTTEPISASDVVLDDVAPSASPAISPPDTDTLVAAILQSPTVDNTFSVPSGYAQRALSEFTGLADKTQAASGSTGTATWTNHTESSFVGHVALKPAASSGGTDNLLADDVEAASSVSTPALAEVGGGGLDFKVLRGSAVIASGQTSLTLTEGTDFSLEAGLASDAWFFRITSNHFTGMGRTSLGNNQNADDFMVSASYSGDNVVLQRYGSANNCRVDWEIIQYIGSAGGANEIKVREKGTRSIASGSATDSFALPGSVVDSGNVIPWITGQRTSNTGRNNVNRGLFTSDISGSNFALDRGTTGNTATVSYAVVEFTGSNWTITKQVNTARSGTNQTVTLSTSLTDFTKAFIHPTYLYRTTATVGLDDASERVRLTSNTQMNFWSSTATDAANKEHIVWISENPDITVNEYTGTMAGVGEEEVDDITVTQVADIEQTSVMVSNDSTGSGTAMPRGFVNVTLLNDTTVRLRQSDNGQTSDYSILVIEWPESAGGGGDALLAEDVEAASEVTAPSIGQEHVLSAGDVESSSEVSAPAPGQQHGLLANDVESTSEVTQPALGQSYALNANSIESASEITAPALGQEHALSASDAESASETTNPAIGQEHRLSASSVESTSEVSTPALSSVAGTDNLLANDVEATSELNSPALGQVHALTATGVESASEVSTPNLGQEGDLFAVSVEAASEVSVPTLGQVHVLAASDVEALSEVSQPALGGDAPQKRVVGGDDAPYVNEREEFWRKKAEEWLEERIIEAPKVAKRSRKKRKAFVQAFWADAEEILAKSPGFEPRIDHVRSLVEQLDTPQPDYTALAALVDKIQTEQAIRARRKRDLEAVLILAA